MHVELRKQNSADRVLDLGGGGNRHPLADVCVDVRPAPGVDFTCDLATFPWPIADADFNVVHCAYCLEHIPYASVPMFLAETLRILRPGGHAVFVLPNTAAQLQWIVEHPEGWDGKDSFTATSELLYGSQNMPTEEGGDANTHKAYFSPASVKTLFKEAGFLGSQTQPCNERGTDMVVVAKKELVVRTESTITPGMVAEVYPDRELLAGLTAAQIPNVLGTNAVTATPPVLSREELFDKHYFHGGAKVGGYAREGYWDYPVHEVTARHVLDRKPKSVLELGCARGYIGKRIHDAGVPYQGMEISRHCYLTRVFDDFIRQDLCQTPWRVNPFDREPFLFDLCFSIATLEHVPEEHLPAVIAEMARTCRRGLHGIDFGHNDDGFDKTHCSLFLRERWLELFAKHAPGWPVEVVDKEFLESTRAFPEGDAAFWDAIRKGDGKVKINVGSFTTMFQRGWVNLDVHDLDGWAAQHGYTYRRHDVRQGLPWNTGEVDLIYCGHMLEHLTYKEGLAFLRECRRVLKPDGAMRVIVPDAELLCGLYHNHNCDPTDPALVKYADGLGQFDEINDECAVSPTAAGKLWSLLVPGHLAAYDPETLCHALNEAGFNAWQGQFRGQPYPVHGGQTADGHTLYTGEQAKSIRQILVETLDVLPCLSLYCEAVPRLG